MLARQEAKKMARRSHGQSSPVPGTMPKKRMETFNDLIEEAKTRTVVWIVCVVGLAYFLSLTSKLVWLNIPLSFLIISSLRYLSLEVEIRRRVRATDQPSYFSYLQRNQLPPHDPLLMPALDTIKWKRSVDSPAIAAAIEEFIQKIVQTFVTDLWYSCITPDKEFPELLCVVINDVIGELSQRVKHINLIDMLTRDMVDLIGTHLELYRKNQAYIGVDVMAKLSSEERDERLKHSLTMRKELHPALRSPENEYMVLRQLMGGVVAVVLRPQEVQSPVIRCLARELLTCVVMQPIMDFASPGFINEIIELFVLLSKEDSESKKFDKDAPWSSSGKPSKGNTNASKGGAVSSDTRRIDDTKSVEKEKKQDERNVHEMRNLSHGESTVAVLASTVSDLHSRPAEWAQALNAVRQRRVQVLAPENLDNLWTKGRNYRKKEFRITNMRTETASEKHKNAKGKDLVLSARHASAQRDIGTPVSMEAYETSQRKITHYELITTKLNTEHIQEIGRVKQGTGDIKQDMHLKTSIQGRNFDTGTSKAIHRRTASDGMTPDEWQKLDNSYISNVKKLSSPVKVEGSKLHEVLGSTISENQQKEPSQQTRISSFPRLKCWVLGAHLEKVRSKSFAVYSIAVADSENNTWFVDRRYSNFEQLHRRLRDIPNYSLHLPPKRILSSSLDDYFVQQRCILLDKYLKDLLSIPNIAEQHEVWDFLSATSQNYSFGKTPSVMKTLAVTVDDAMDDIVRQLKGVSDGLLRKVSGVSSSLEGRTSGASQLMRSLGTLESTISNDSICDGIDRSQSISDEDVNSEDMIQDDAHYSGQQNAWHSDGELHFEPTTSRGVSSKEPESSDSENNPPSGAQIGRVNSDGASLNDMLTSSETVEDEVRVPPEWIPPKLSVPLLNLVDNIFQLNRRGWLRRQVLWISKQILQLVMEDAIDDWLLRQIEWLRRDDVMAMGIKWIQDVILREEFLNTKGSFKQQTDNSSGCTPNKQNASRDGLHNKFQVPPSFEQQLEASRRAKLVYDTLLGGAPSTVVSLIGGKQYRRCAKDIYYFLQSRICVKQLAYSLLELLLITAFPELHDLVLSIHSDSLDIQHKF